MPGLLIRKPIIRAKTEQDSDLRQIPDNQEVFLSADSETSIVVEILQMVEEGRCSTDLWEAVK